MAYKQKGWSPFTQCFPGSNCKPGGRRSNKLRQKWNKLKANVSDFFTKDKPAQFENIETPDWVSPIGSDRHQPLKQSLVNYTSNIFEDKGPPPERCKDCLGKPDYKKLQEINKNNPRPDVSW